MLALVLYTTNCNSDYMVYSNFTWKVFEDSGWYKINYTVTESIDQLKLLWGKGK